MNRAVAAMIAALWTTTSACVGRHPAALSTDRLDTIRQEAVSIGPLPSLEAKRRAISAYKDFLKTGAAGDQRADALVRLADLTADMEEQSAAETASPRKRPDYAQAIALYKERLALFPNRPDNDRALYQLSRRLDQTGSVDEAVEALDSLVTRYPKSPHFSEAAFRLGEMQFERGRMREAARTFSRILDDRSFGERALYHLAWCRYRLQEFAESLRLFSQLTDRKLSNGSVDPEKLPPGDRELVSDAFRGIALSLDGLGGAPAIEGALNTVGRRPYEARFYRALGDHYTKKERISDAARTYEAYVQSHPSAPDAITFQDAVVNVYLRGNFPREALAAKADMARRFGPGGAWYAKASEADRRAWDPTLRRAVREVAEASHARAQRSRSPEDYALAVSWYRTVLSRYGSGDDAGILHFELAEALFESGRIEEAAVEYGRSAYEDPHHTFSADAAYDLLVCREELLSRPSSGDDRQKEWIRDAERFVRTFPGDSRAPAVAVRAAQRLFDRKEYDRAKDIARAAPLEKVDRKLAIAATDLMARSDDAQGRDASAEEGYRRVLRLLGPDEVSLRRETAERLAAAIYRQGEVMRGAGNLRGAAEIFERVEKEAPGTRAVPVALYDAGAALASLHEDARAASLFRQLKETYPGAPVIAQATLQLALANEALGRPREAAASYEEAAHTLTTPAERIEAAEAAGRLYESLGLWSDASRVYRKIADQDGLSTIQRMNLCYKEGSALDRLGRIADAAAWWTEVVQDSGPVPSDQDGVARTLKARAAYRLAEYAYKDFSKIRLAGSLKRTLEQKQRALRSVLDALALAASFRVREVTTAATYRMGETLEAFKMALVQSERPARLTVAQREQYDFLLEERARPYDKQAATAYESNLRRLWDEGLYDDWIQKSIDRLSALRPDRYHREEAGEAPRADLSKSSAETHNRVGIALRREGKFADAEREYRAALNDDPTFGDAAINLAILYELYLGRSGDALTYYQTYVKLGGSKREDVQRWIEDIEKRTGKTQHSENVSSARQWS